MAETQEQDNNILSVNINKRRTPPSNDILPPTKRTNVPIDCEFPVWGLLPKKETGVVSFLNKYPDYDGRGTVIAILDSGVDPAAEGLKLTSTNETKVIERFDCSGAGDVDTGTVIKSVGADGCITGVTGRKLKIPETWKNPTGVWRVGILYPYSLYPVKLKERVQEHRREHLWNSGHKPALVEVNKLLQDFERDIGSKSTPLSYEDKLLKEELDTRLEILTAADKKYSDLGPSYDCVLFHDGDVWRACIDTSESGELSSGPLLGEYSATHEHAHLTPLDEMTISINVHEDGAVLEVVGMCSTHGTHVAAIASGCFPDEPDRNGVAPGAKIISLTIGDSRLGSMETGTALIRACIKVMELSKKMNIDVVNMSYGEHAHWSNAGRIGDVICEVVNRYGVSWVVSGGNHGPALCTVGAPPDIAQPILIGVAAYVSPEMMSATYSMRARLAGGAFSWSSRGPTADGAAGLSVAAPGGAVTSVARFTLKNSQLMNGTSMAAPHVAGAVALLVSGLKALQLPHSPYFMKRSLENSATYLEHVEPWAQGCGLLNVEKAFELLSTYGGRPERDVTFSLAAGAEGGKGVLLRPAPDDPPKELSVTVEPRFLQSHHDMEDKGVIPRQISFGVRLALTCSAPWVSLPAHLDLRNAARALALRIDHGALPPGAHHTSINAYDVSCVAQGPLFRVPVTVVRALPAPRGAPALHEPDALFKPAAIRRHFIFVPEDATWGVLRLSSREPSAGRFLVHVMQLLPRRSCRSHETLKMLTVAPDAPAHLPFQLVGGVMVEVTIAKYWASLGEQTVTYTLELGGLRPDCGPRLTLGAAGGLRAVTLRSLRPHDVQPVAQLKHAEPVYRPSETKISPLSGRDVIPPNRQIYQLINTYNFHLAKGTEVSPIVSLLCDMLYESEFESQMWMLYSGTKQLMAVGDAYPLKYSVKLEKGEYVLRLNVRHESRALLERLQELPVVLQQRLPQPIQLDAYAAQSNALSGGKKLGTCATVGGALTPVYFGPVPADKIGRSNLTVGQTLTGHVSFAKDELPRKVDTYELQYIVCEPPKRPNNNNSGGGGGGGGGKDKPKPNDEYADAYRDFAAGWLAKLEGDKLEQVYSELTAQFPAWAGAHVAYLNSIDPPTDHKKLPNPDVAPDVTAAWCEQIIAIADKAIKLIDQEKLLAYLGMKNDSRPDAAKIKQENEKQRGYLVDALCRRGVALCRLRALAGAAAGGAGGADALRANMLDLLKFTDITADAKVIQYGVWHHTALQQWGRALRLLQRLQEERPSREAEARAARVARRLRWDHLALHMERAAPLRFPHAYRPF